MTTHFHFDRVCGRAEASGNPSRLTSYSRCLGVICIHDSLNEGITAPRQSANRPAILRRKAVGMSQSRHAATGFTFSTHSARFPQPRSPTRTSLACVVGRFNFPVPVLAEIPAGYHSRCNSVAGDIQAQASTEKPLPEMGRTLAAGNSIEGGQLERRSKQVGNVRFGGPSIRKEPARLLLIPTPGLNV